MSAQKSTYLAVEVSTKHMTLNNGLLHSSDVSQHEVAGLYGTQNGCGMFTHVSNLCLSTGFESAGFVSIYIQVLVGPHYD